MNVEHDAFDVVLGEKVDGLDPVARQRIRPLLFARDALEELEDDFFVVNDQ